MMHTVQKVGKKLYLLVGDTNAGNFGTAHFLTRNGARLCKSDKDVIVEVPLTIYQQKRINQMQGAL